VITAFIPGPRIENLDLVADPDKSFVMIMKDGKTSRRFSMWGSVRER